MLRVLRPGGLVLLQEPVADPWEVPMPGDAWPRWRALIRAGFQARGGDFDAGRSLRKRLEREADDVCERRIVHTLPARHPYAALPVAFGESLRAAWRASGLVHDDELTRLRQLLRKALQQPDASVTTFALVQVWGRKRAGGSAYGAGASP
jgi:hypothetical protein